MIKHNSDKAIIYWLLSGCFLIYVMVVVGGLTRLTHSGLSITDWHFMGSVPPLNEQMWQERFMKYQESPEFKKINSSMTLEQFKPIFLWEYIHRMIGRTMMYVFAAGFIYFLVKKRIRKEMWPGMALLFVMGALQAVVGWWMVYSGLRDKPAVSHYRLATHLMSALTLFAFTFWFSLKLIYPNSDLPQSDARKLRGTILLFFVVLVIQIIYGAFTAGYVEGDNAHVRPGHIFNTWPKMGTEWMPEQVSMKGSWAENLMENASGIQFMHRSIAFVVVLLVCIIWYRSNKLSLTKAQTTGITALIYGVTIQFLLGVFTLLYNVPVVMGALHQSGAFFLFGTGVFLLYHFYKQPSKL